MEHFFSLPVFYAGEEQSYQGRLVTFGYTYKFHIIMDKKEIIFERDDEMNYRAINLDQDNAVIDVKLLEAVAQSLQKLSDQ